MTIMDRYKVVVIAASLILLRPAAAQMSPNTSKDIPPPAKKAARVQITEGPSLEIFRNNEAIIRWTSNNPGGSDEHWGVVKYGTDPDNLNLTAKGHVRLNQSHSYTVFRVRVEGLQPHTTYYYKVDSQDSLGASDKVACSVKTFTTP
jgi:phosphodiesterase/alkaline phosphatase D-like protein